MRHAVAQIPQQQIIRRQAELQLHHNLAEDLDIGWFSEHVGQFQQQVIPQMIGIHLFPHQTLIGIASGRESAGGDLIGVRLLLESPQLRPMRPTARPVSRRRLSIGDRAFLGAYAAANSFSDTSRQEKELLSNDSTISLASCHSLLKPAFPPFAVVSGESGREGASWHAREFML